MPTASSSAPIRVRVREVEFMACAGVVRMMARTSVCPSDYTRRQAQPGQAMIFRDSLASQAIFRVLSCFPKIKDTGRYR